MSMAISTRFLLLLSFLCCLSQTASAVTETVRKDPCPRESHPMYQSGSHKTCFEPANATVEEGGSFSLRVAIPEDAGSYPVVQFQHGTVLSHTDYEGLMRQVASWGFIVVAPQMYESGFINLPRAPPATTEITNARSILNWMKTGLIASLPGKYANHTPNFDKVALAGHSRGGQVVFGLALTHYGHAEQKYSAIVGLDPVDGKSSLPPVLLQPTPKPTEESSLDAGVPTLIVGTGFGSQGGVLACAPKPRGHINFYRDLKPPSFHFVATNNGHNDFTQDCSFWDKWNLFKLVVRCSFLCPDGPSRQCMRQFSAGITVAFLQEVFFQNNASLLAALNGTARAPVDLDRPQCKGNISCPHEARHEYADI